jgi:3-hydroxyacyl-CoA dehydrogenase
VVDKLIEDYRKQEGITPRKISDEEIIQRCILALSNEGAKILEEGIAQRASDVDMVYLTGYGFPVFRGGPMFYADTLGLYQTVRLMKRFEQQTGDAYWKPAALLEKLAAEGKSFTGA